MEYQRSDNRRVEGLVTIGGPGQRVWVGWAGMSIEGLKLADRNGGGKDGHCTGSMRSYAALATGVMNPCLRRVRTGVMKNALQNGVSKIGERSCTSVS